jgi:hypothetical protein
MNFFSQKAAPGRPAKKTSKAGRPAQKRSALLAEVPIAAAVAPKAKKIKATRQNWSKGEGLKRMSDAVAEWKVELAKPEKNRDSVHLFSEKRGIPYTTFQDHIAKDKKNSLSWVAELAGNLSSAAKPKRSLSMCLCAKTERTKGWVWVVPSI